MSSDERGPSYFAAEIAKHAPPNLRPRATRFDLICGDSSKWLGSGIDLVLCNPYAPLPECLWGVPSIISLFEGKEPRKERTERWIGGHELKFLSKWGAGGKNAVYVANLPAKQIDFTHLIEDHADAPKGEGWFPIELPYCLLSLYARAGMVVWDGFMGRGTTGRACRMLNMGFVGIDKEQWRVDYARNYVGC